MEAELLLKNGIVNFVGENQVEILPLCDMHIGSIFSDIKLFHKAIDYIRKTDNCYTILMGDLTNNSNLIKGFDGVFFQNMTPDEQEEYVIEALEPIKHKIITCVDGNHGAWSARAGHSPDRSIAKALGVPYSGDIAFFQILLGKFKSKKSAKVWNVGIHHGCGGGATDGGKINSTLKLLGQCNNLNLAIVGHFHKIMWDVVDSYNLYAGKLKKNRAHVCICGSSYEHITKQMTETGLMKNYPLARMMKPSTLGFLKMTLYASKCAEGQSRMTCEIFE